MKTKFLHLLAVACFVTGGTALLAATDPAPVATPKDSAKCAQGKCSCEKKAGAPEKKTVMLTGSNLPQQVTKVGRITDSAQPVTVVSHDDLEKSGEINLAAALRKTVPAIH